MNEVITKFYPTPVFYDDDGMLQPANVCFEITVNGAVVFASLMEPDTALLHASFMTKVADYCEELNESVVTDAIDMFGLEDPL